MDKVAVAYGFNEFNFAGCVVRTLDKEGETLWVVSDIASAIGILNSRDMARRIDKANRMQVYDLSRVVVHDSSKINSLDKNTTQDVDLERVVVNDSSKINNLDENSTQDVDLERVVVNDSSKINELSRLKDSGKFEKIHYLDRGDSAIAMAYEVNMVNESGLYALLMKSYKPKAKEFQRWLAEKVVPSIRKEMDSSKNNSSETKSLAAKPPKEKMAEIKPVVKTNVVRKRVKTAIEQSLPEGVTLAVVRRSIDQTREFASIFTTDQTQIAEIIKANIINEFGQKFAVLIGATPLAPVAPPASLPPIDTAHQDGDQDRSNLSQPKNLEQPPVITVGKNGVKGEKPKGFLIPTEIASIMGWQSAIEANKKLEAMGFQSKETDGNGFHWVPTKRGLIFARPYLASKDGVIINATLSWHQSIIPQLELHSQDLFADNFAFN